MGKGKIRTKHFSYGLLITMVGFVLLLLFSPVVGIRFDTVLSGSMNPTLETGDMVVVTSVEPSELKVGDIIVFNSPIASGLVCHRIIDVKQDSELVFQTKGDNNEDPDPYLVPSANVVGKVQADIPSMGYVIQYLRGPFGLLLILSLVLAVIFIPDKGGASKTKNMENGNAEVAVQDKD
ncbi:MAG: signal peptidase I [Methanomassiliicoccales archaeon]|nr:signal peptidase I [Methanomassiliicoccales archaeon]